MLANFNGSQWTPGDREIPESQTATGTLPPLDGVSSALPRKEFKYDIRVGSDFASTWLPTTAQVTRIAAGTDWRYDTSTRDFIAARDDVTTADSSYDFTGVQLTYDADTMNSAVSGAGTVAGTFTDVPPALNNEIRRLAASVTADAPTRFQKAQLLQQWFREDGGFRYDRAQVESAGNGGADLMAFMNDRVGYCEQFAASMAIMARVLGIPSRVAVGFLEPERATNGAWVFSAHDLHAWPELYFPGSGWVRFEPTPSDRAGNVPDYTTAEFAPVTASPSPSASRSTELLPDRGATASADAGSADEETSSIPWLPVLAGIAGLALVALLLHTPRLVRRARRRRRLTGDIEDLWVELRGGAPGLGHAGPGGGAPRRPRGGGGRSLAPTGRRVARAAAGQADRRHRPSRPPAPRPRPGTRGGPRPRPPRGSARAQPLRPRPGDLRRRALPRRRRPGGGVPRRRCHAPRRTSCPVVAGLRRRTAYVLAAVAVRWLAHHDHPRRPRDQPHGRRARQLTGRSVPVRDGDRALRARPRR